MMNSRGISWFCILQILFQTSSGFGYLGEFYNLCGRNFTCGNAVVGISYPFVGSTDPQYCGHPGFMLKCEEENSMNVTTIEIAKTTYRVLQIDQSAQKMTIAREDLMVGICPEEMVNTTLDISLFDYVSPYKNITYLYGCPDTKLPTSSKTISCGKTGYDPSVYVLLGSHGPQNCEKSVTVHVPVSKDIEDQGSINLSGLVGILRQGLEVKWKSDDYKACRDCKESNGRCGYNLGRNETTCFCRDAPFVSTTCAMATTSSMGGKRKSSIGMVAGLSIAGAAIAGFGFSFLLILCRRRRKQRTNLPLAVQTSTAVSKEISNPPSMSTPISTPSSKYTSSIPSYPSSNSDLGRGSSYFGAQVFSYAELEQATDNFNPSKELGEGGFGTVYYGELPDGRLIAVKRLFENNFRRVEQFMNEVKILMQLHHRNLVTLHGCTSRTSRELLLVYEYVPNGTVADHVHGKRSKSGLLSWPVRLNIAIETAEALAFLHKSGIIHRDVKTNNILLDKDFHVKVADFGLSRLFPTDVTHVSTAPQGTPGYVDPEYHQCYQLTEKSDVYSFGVVLIELISSLMAVDTSRHRHDINLSNMAVTKIQNHSLHELVDPSLGFETNNTVRRRITLVAELAFQCLQQERDMRPSMAEVLECMKRIRDDSTNANMVEVVDILVDEDESGPLKDGIVPPPPPEA